MMTPEEHKHQIVQFAQAAGFDLVRVASVPLPPHHEETFRAWIAAGHHGSMTYLSRRLQDGRGVETILPGAQSVISLAMNYFRADTRERHKGEGLVSRYAVTRDYHKVMGKRLQKLCQYMSDEFGAVTKPYVDTGPILERAYADASGLGYIGKNSCLITEEFGSWVLLAEVISTLALPPDRNLLKINCGRCRRCIDDCPTNAIHADRTIDSRKCISYLTIENRDGIPESLRPLMGAWLFGCDICQEVCPHNGRAAPIKADATGEVRIHDRLLAVRELLAIVSDEEFHRRFAGTPIMRAGRRGITRNAAVVAGNLRDAEAVPALQAIAAGDDEMLAEHANWALARIASGPG